MIQNQGGADLGGITIKKVTNSPDGSIEFEFSQTVEANIGGDFPDFKLTKDSEKPFSNVAPGIYEVTETNIPSPYSLGDITYVDPDGDNSIVDVGAAMATINLSPNEQLSVPSPTTTQVFPSH